MTKVLNHDRETDDAENAVWSGKISRQSLIAHKPSQMVHLFGFFLCQLIPHGWEAVFVKHGKDLNQRRGIGLFRCAALFAFPNLSGRIAVSVSAPIQRNFGLLLSVRPFRSPALRSQKESTFVQRTEN